MAKKRKDEPEPELEPDGVAGSKGDRYSVLIDQDLQQKLLVIKAAFGISLPSWINNTIRPRIDEQYALAVDKMGLQPKK